MSRLARVCTVAALSFLAHAEAQEHALRSLMEAHDYVQKRVSSYDRSGGNADYREIKPGDTLTLLDESGPGIITHMWITIASPEKFHLKKLVLRMYWDGEPTPSVETPIGDFFGLGLGDYFRYGHANHRSDNFFSVAYWYQLEPHGSFPPLPPVEERLPRIYPVGGPGNAGKSGLP